MTDIGQITLTAAAGVSVLAFLPVLTQFVDMFPELWASMFRTAVCIRIDDSRKTQRNRDVVFYACIPALITTGWMSGMYAPARTEALSAPLQLLVCAGAVLGYMLLRAAMGRMLPRRRFKPKVYAAAIGSSRNFWTLLSFLLFLSETVLRTAGADYDLSLIIMYCITGVSYALYIIRRFQIFASDSNYLTAILYLCALEILPTAILATSAVVLSVT